METPLVTPTDILVHSASPYKYFQRKLSVSNDHKYLIAVYYESGFWTSKNETILVELWEIKPNKLMRTIEIKTKRKWYSILFFNDKYIISSHEYSIVKVWCSITGRELKTLKDHKEGNGIWFGSNVVTCCDVFSSLGNYYIATGHHERDAAKVWLLPLEDKSSGSKLSRWTIIKSDIISSVLGILGKIHNRQNNLLRTFLGHTADVYSIVFTKDGQHLITGSGDTTVILWDVRSGANIRTYRGHSHRVFSVSASSNNKYVFSGSEDRTVILWNMLSGGRLKTFIGSNRVVTDIAVSLDNSFFVTAHANKIVRIWDCERGQVIHEMSSEHTYSVNKVLLSSTGKMVLLSTRLYRAASMVDLRDFPSIPGMSWKTLKPFIMLRWLSEKKRALHLPAANMTHYKGSDPPVDQRTKSVVLALALIKMDSYDLFRCILTFCIAH